ncbi:MAG: Holliday junction branch migration DNA helicase RuvB [Candidatus Paceibacterota bacterium]
MSTPIKPSEEITLDSKLRPRTWEGYIGQDKVKTNLKLIIEAAKGRKESCDHLLFYGQAGLGKTTLAYIISNEMKTNIKTTSGPALEKTGDMAAILTNIEPYEILFIDEIHRLGSAVEEVLYPALESRKLHLIVGKGPSAKTLSIDLPPFTVVAATTKANMLSSPLRSRFGAIFKLDYYTEEDIEGIIKRSANLMNVPVTKEALVKMAKASRFTPRVANRILKRCRDWAQVNGNGEIDEKAVISALEMLEIDSLGLEKADRFLLETIIHKFDGGPVGIRSLVASLNEDEGIIEEVYEPFLLKLGLIKRTPNGRIATDLAYNHLGIDKKSGKNLV